jgi:hypothetical protein
MEIGDMRHYSARSRPAVIRRLNVFVIPQIRVAAELNSFGTDSMNRGSGGSF